MTQYLQCLKKSQEIQAKMREGAAAIRERKDSSQRDDDLAKNARALRRSE